MTTQLGLTLVILAIASFLMTSHCAAVTPAAVLTEQAQKLNYLEALVLQQSGRLTSLSRDLEILTAKVNTPNPDGRRSQLIAFEAQFSRDPHHNVFDNEVMLFDNVLTNKGGGYDVINGTFIAPTTGVYVMTVKVTPSPKGHIYVYLMLNDKRVDSADANDDQGLETGHSTKILELQRGDRVNVVKNNGVMSVRGWAHTRFNGFMLRATA